MTQLQELKKVGQYESFSTEGTVENLIEELEVEGDFTVLVNGSKVDSDYVIEEDDEVVILPHLKGG